MKKFLPFILGLLCTFPAIGQNQALKNLQVPTYKKYVDQIVKSAPYDDLKLDSMIIESFNSTDSIYTNSNLDVYNYSNGKEVLSTHYNWDNNTAKWAVSFKNEYTYDANGYQILNISWNWDAIASQWNHGYKSETYNDQNGNDTLNLNYNWNSTLGDWVAGVKNMYEYNDAGTQTHYLMCQWNGGNATWDSVIKTDFYQDEFGVDSLSLTSFWDQGTARWNTTNKAKSFKNEAGLDTLINQYQWSAELNEWIPSQKSEVKYNQNGVDSLVTVYSWNSIDSVWMGVIMFAMSYEADKSFVNQYMGQDGQWLFFSKITYYYSEYTPTGIKNPSNTEVGVYPNPARDFIMVNMPGASNSATIELYNIQGMKVLDQRLQEGKQVSTNGLPKGLYLYKITNNGIRSVGKLMIE
jgi:hypothetical protein